MASKSINKSIEEQVEDWAIQYLNTNHISYLTKTELMDPEIDDALRIEEQKKDGNGGNYPDIKLFIDIDSAKIPIMIKCKGTKGDLCKLDENGEPANKKKNGISHLSNISK